jgi:hypothetical protein
LRAVPAGSFGTSLLASQPGSSYPLIDPSQAGVETRPEPPAPTSAPAASADIPGGESRFGAVRPPPVPAPKAARNVRARPPSSPPIRKGEIIFGAVFRLGHMTRTGQGQVSAAPARRGEVSPALSLLSIRRAQRLPRFAVADSPISQVLRRCSLREEPKLWFLHAVSEPEQSRCRNMADWPGRASAGFFPRFSANCA